MRLDVTASMMAIDSAIEAWHLLTAATVSEMVIVVARAVRCLAIAASPSVIVTVSAIAGRAFFTERDDSFMANDSAAVV